jgi:hypothetical protein
VLNAKNASSTESPAAFGGAALLVLLFLVGAAELAYALLVRRRRA